VENSIDTIDFFKKRILRL